MRVNLGIVLLLSAITVGCDVHPHTPPNPELTMGLRFSCADFSSDFGSRASPSGLPDRRGVLGVNWVGVLDAAAHRDAETYFLAHMHLVSLATGAEVAGHGSRGMVRIDGENAEEFTATVGGSAAYSFVPDGPLADGWYVFVVDTREWVATHPYVTIGIEPTGSGVVEDAIMYARIQVGERPTWFATYASCGSTGDHPGCILGPILTDPASGASPVFVVLADGAVDPACRETRDESGWSWLCPNYPDGTLVELRLVAEGGVRPIREGLAEHQLSMPTLTQLTLVDPRFGVDTAREAL